MQSLPFLIVHGTKVFALGLALAAALGAFVYVALRRGAARMEASRARSKLGDPRSPGPFAENEVAVLSGEIAISGEAAARFEDGEPAAIAAIAAATGARGTQRDRGTPVLSDIAAARAERLFLRTGGEVVELLGVPRVLAASRMLATHRRWKKLPAACRVRISLALPPAARAEGARAEGATAEGARVEGESAWWEARSITLLSLREGDRVCARGVLAREAETGSPERYRHAQSAWTLAAEDAGSGGVARLPIAFEGEPVLVLPRSRVVLASLASAALFACGVFVAGAIANGVASHRLAFARFPGHGDVMDAAEIAAMSPFHRAEALSLAASAERQRCERERGPEHVDAIDAIESVRGDCSARSLALLEHGRLERAAQIAAGCAPEAEARAEYMLGQFESASAAVAWSNAHDDQEAIFHVRAHLLAGRLDRAAAAARIASISVMGSSDSSAHRSTALRCLADALAARSGERDALGRLDRDSDNQDCRELAADARGEAAVPSPAAYADREELVRDEQGLAGARGCDAAEDPVILRFPRFLFGARAQLVTVPSLRAALLARRTEPDPCPRRGQLAAELAVFSALAGDDREARRLAETAARSMTSGYSYTQAALLRAAIELYTGNSVSARALLAASPEGSPDRAALQKLADLHDGARLDESPDPDLDNTGLGLSPWMLATSRDGRMLADWLVRNSVETNRAYLFLGARHIDAPEEVLSWLRHGTRAVTPFWAPAGVLFEAAARRRAAEALGDDALARSFDATITAFRRALGRREIAVPLSVLDHL